MDLSLSYHVGMVFGYRSDDASWLLRKDYLMTLRELQM